jgi:mercuric ion transport protein
MNEPSPASPQPILTCSCTPGTPRNRRFAKWATTGGLLGALGICAACCLLPFAFVTAGIATAWAGTLESLAPYKWWLVAVTAGLLGYGFYVACRKPRTACADGSECPTCASNHTPVSSHRAA